MKLQRRWDFESIEGEAFSWNAGRRGFDYKNGEHVGDEALDRFLGSSKTELGEEIFKNNIRSLDFQRVHAVRR